MLQAASADAVRALFIFLHLLECQTERIAEIGLGHAEHQAAHAHSFSDVGVSRVYSVLWHRVPVAVAAVCGSYTTLPCVGRGGLSGSFPLVRRETFPSEPTRQSCDHDQRGQGCAAPEGLDLDDGARRGRMMAGLRMFGGQVRPARGRAFCFTMVADSYATLVEGNDDGEKDNWEPSVDWHGKSNTPVDDIHELKSALRACQM
jgi:hypothetical protein